MIGKRWLAVLPALLAATLDRILKWHSFAALPPGDAVVLFPGAQYRYFLNTGLVFSLFNNSVAVAAWIVAALVLAAWLTAKLKAEISWIGLSRNLAAVFFIALGGASNLYDRIIFGGVIDYILLFSRSAINFADIMILAGIALLVLRRVPKGDISA